MRKSNSLEKAWKPGETLTTLCAAFATAITLFVLAPSQSGANEYYCPQMLPFDSNDDPECYFSSFPNGAAKTLKQKREKSVAIEKLCGEPPNLPSLDWQDYYKTPQGVEPPKESGLRIDWPLYFSTQSLTATPEQKGKIATAIKKAQESGKAADENYDQAVKTHQTCWTDTRKKLER